MFDSVQVKFNNINFYKSPLANARIVPFVKNYLEILKAIINDVQTTHFWFFASFCKLDNFDFDYIPEQHEKDQIHVWYTTHPKGGLNKEGNVFLIPTKKFKEQINNIKLLRDFKDINYHADPLLEVQPMTKAFYDLDNPFDVYNNNPKCYKWMINKDQKDIRLPNFYPSFWEDIKVYTFGKSADVMLVPYVKGIKQFYDIDNIVHAELNYSVKPMDIIFLSYDEPNAEEKFVALKQKYPRAKHCKGVQGRSLAYITAASMSDTGYFYFVTPKMDILDDFTFDFQPNRLKNPCHYIFNSINPVNKLRYGHGAVLLYNKKLCFDTVKNRKVGIDFTLSAPHTVVPEMYSNVNNFNQNPIMSWRTAFREVVKLLQSEQTVESKYRLKHWLQLGDGDYADWVHKGANDAKNYFNKHRDNDLELKKSYELLWLDDYFNKKYN